MGDGMTGKSMDPSVGVHGQNLENDPRMRVTLRYDD
jgi:hypothetical protein